MVQQVLNINRHGQAIASAGVSSAATKTTASAAASSFTTTATAGTAAAHYHSAHAGASSSRSTLSFLSLPLLTAAAVSCGRIGFFAEAECLTDTQIGTKRARSFTKVARDDLSRPIRIQIKGAPLRNPYARL